MSFFEQYKPCMLIKALHRFHNTYVYNIYDLSEAGWLTNSIFQRLLHLKMFIKARED